MTDRPARGQVWEYIAGPRQYRAVVLSSDEYNSRPEFQPVGLLAARDAPPVGVLGVRLGTADPLPGATVRVAAPIRLVRTGLVRNLGWLTEPTMVAVERAVRDFFELP